MSKSSNNQGKNTNIKPAFWFNSKGDLKSDSWEVENAYYSLKERHIKEGVITRDSKVANLLEGVFNVPAAIAYVYSENPEFVLKLLTRGSSAVKSYLLGLYTQEEDDNEPSDLPEGHFYLPHEMDSGVIESLLTPEELNTIERTCLGYHSESDSDI